MAHSAAAAALWLGKRCETGHAQGTRSSDEADAAAAAAVKAEADARTDKGGSAKIGDST
jgi:hypothetical protein